MPPFTRAKKRDIMTLVKVNPTMYYAWKAKDISGISGVSTGDLADLGHETQGVVGNSILIIGATAPQPPRVTKKLSNQAAGQQQSVSTFCAFDKVSTAAQKGWSLTKPRKAVGISAANANRGTQTAIATLSNGTLYAFPLNSADFTSFSNNLGLDSSTKITSETERQKLVSGSTRPKPGRARRQLDDGSFFTCFYSTAKIGDVTQAGFDIVSEEVLLVLPSSGGGGAST